MGDACSHRDRRRRDQSNRLFVTVSSRPVADDWAEQRRRSPERAAAAITSADDDSLPAGASEIRRLFTRIFLRVLWERPDRRKRWALRHRTEPAVHEVADELAWTVAVNTQNIVDPYDLAAVVRHAFLDEFAIGRELDGDVGVETSFFGITPAVARMLDWLIRHHPEAAHHAISEIIGDAERRWSTPRHVSARSVRTALALDGQLDKQTRKEFLDRALPPDHREQRARRRSSPAHPSAALCVLERQQDVGL